MLLNSLQFHSMRRSIHLLIYHFSPIKSLLEAFGTQKASANSFFAGCAFVLLEDNIYMYKELNVAVDFSL